MSFRININESNKNVFIQQNYGDVDNDTIKVRNAFSENGVYEFYYTGNIVEFTVPTSGTYKIEAWGAVGGGGYTPMGPKGAYSKSFVLLNKDERIKILVGEKGYPGRDYSEGSNNWIYCGGGAGGTYIAKGNIPLCVAGGGGSLTLHAYSTIQSHACGQSTQLSADFGYGQATLKMGGTGSGSSGGGGFEGNGADGSNGWGKGGYSFINGGAKQTSGTSYGTYGGFGGGASNHGYCGRASGGGGYTGGSASSSITVQGGGGGSYFEGFFNNEVSEAISGCNESLPTNPGTNGNGFAKLTLLRSTPTVKDNKKISCSQYRTPVLWTIFVTLLSL
jgi:hypothetical protein